MNALKIISRVFPILLVVVSCTIEPTVDKVDFATQIKPLLKDRCVNCHNSNALFGHLNLENRAYAFRERPDGAVIIPGNAEQSRFYLVLTLPEGERKAMPPTGHRIPPEEVILLKRWIDEGAAWPEGADGVVLPITDSSVKDS
jgi:hypothetical protein